MFDAKTWYRRIARASLFERFMVLLLATIIAFGLWQIGGGVYIKTKAVLAQILLNRAWAATNAAPNMRHKPWSWADSWPVAKLTVPRLKAQAIVLSDTNGSVLAFAPGHMAGTPKINQDGTTIFAAHRDTHFSFLKHLKQGDRIKVEKPGGKIYTFTVSHTEIVRADASGINPHSPGKKLALVTCYPFNAITPGGPLRYVVHAMPAKPQISTRP